MTLQDHKPILQTHPPAFSEVHTNRLAVDADEEYNTANSDRSATITTDGSLSDAIASKEPLAPQTRLALRRRIMSLEVPTFLLFLSLLLSGSVMTNQELYQTCVAVFHYNESSCEPLRGLIPKTDEAKTIENRIQPYVAKIGMANGILQNVWPGIIVLFVGPWSDKFGRRPILLVNFAAGFLGNIITAALVGFSEILALNPWYYLLGGIPSILVGGGCSMVTVMFCYIADVSDEENMPKRMFYVEIAMGTGALIGSVLSSYVLMFLSVSNICLTSAMLMFIAFLYVFLYIGESLDLAETSFTHKVKKFFDLGLIKELFATCLTRRPNYGRALISCIIVISMMSNFVQHGEHGVFYLFVRSKFNTTLREYTYYTAIVIIIKIIGCGIAFQLFRKLLKLSCAAVCLISIFGGMMTYLTKALAQSFWQMYLGATFSFMSAITAPMLQSIISIVVPSTEIGKVYSMTSFFQTMSTIVASPLYTVVYNNTLNFYPGLFNFISTALYGVCFIFMFFVFLFDRIANQRLAANTLEADQADNSSTKKPPTSQPA
ncbi:probable peptidoglycan muropeptide transporter SLC46 [Eurosta solidaginis]|uniref:probable peptidoglycan muropeptide transporter SLC46 n=1 Tax=Eurosta solidaginis TaxID=178769 RepID=UPI003530DC9D